MDPLQFLQWDLRETKLYGDYTGKRRESEAPIIFSSFQKFQNGQKIWLNSNTAFWKSWSLKRRSNLVLEPKRQKSHSKKLDVHKKELSITNLKGK